MANVRSVFAVVVVCCVLFCLFVSGAHCWSECATLSSASVYFDSLSSFHYKFGVIDKSAVAYGDFDNTLNVTGWGILRIETNAAQSSTNQFYAAGFLEGVLTAARIYENSLVMEQVDFPRGRPASILAFFQAQQEYTVRSVAANPSDPFWQTVGYTQSQFNGLMDGYEAVRAQAGLPALEAFDFWKLSADGDLGDIESAVLGGPDWFHMNSSELRAEILRRSRCSSFVKVTPTFDEIYASHATWYTFSSMNRIYKHFNFQVKDGFIHGGKQSLSSYPGFLVSTDDFYLTETGLIVMETTNSVFNDELYALVKPQSLLSWQRTLVANLLANSGASWAATFARENSGTYNNQWQIVDTKLFTPGQTLAENVLWIVEQLPGLVEAADLTVQLARGYWPSYNIPYFPNIYNLSGYPQIVKQFGASFSYELDPRATIFRRDQTNVKDMDSLRYLMRYNNYLEDPLTGGNPSDTICSRSDLGTGKRASGCIDAKLTSSTLAKKLSADIISGPTTEGNLPPFTWNNFPNSPHYALPNSYQFPFITAQNNW